MSLKFTDIAQGDGQGVAKVNKNFDLVEQTLNQEEVKTVQISLMGDWRVANNNPLTLTITPYGATLRGYIADKDSYLVGSGTSNPTAGYGSNAPLGQLPQSVDFRGKRYKFSVGIPVLCALGGAGGNTGVNGVRMLDAGNGLLYLYEPKDNVQGNGISIYTPVDMYEI
ncbi:hypothetical protein GTO87_03030 [Ligilactobacillus saerimneri]|uniref:Uncharacterized protein n=1 Tax=Ligilactobacillus saerimneri TaxID=228229 RepID=A0A7H9EK48_9LACO|nr:hypothetical protein [Ligilactobacillus saerimneri]QLL77662.1 hypothetical protein GTO87_03030 [Ligilactobacillus saerimneri]